MNADAPAIHDNGRHVSRTMPSLTRRAYLWAYPLIHVQVKELFKSQRDDPSRVKMEPDDADFNGSSMDTSALVVTGTLKSALRVACDMTSKV